MFKLDRIDHVALTVADVDRSVAWYRDVLGLERRHEEAGGSYPAVMYAGPTGIACFRPGHPIYFQRPITRERRSCGTWPSRRIT